MSVQLLVILVPVLFGMMGFAIDLGRLYLVRGELNHAANSMALAAASQLVGTSASLANASAVMQQSLGDTGVPGNKYNFGSLVVGQSVGNLTSTISDPSYFATAAAATGTDTTGAQADGTTARYAQVNLTADAPLLFWSLLSLGQARKTPIAARAVAGISAPLCTACGIEPFAIGALDSGDTVNFGFGDPAAGANYTFAFSCTGTQPQPLAGTGQVIPYAVINRYDSANPNGADEFDQLYRIGAQGLMASATPNPTGSAVPMACSGINDTLEGLWNGPASSLVPVGCTSAALPGVTAAVCGLYSRLDNASPSAACTTAVTDFASLSAAYLPDTDVATGQSDPYAAYSGNGRRIITLPVVLPPLPAGAGATMTVLGFRQFLLQPNSDGTFFDAGDANGRFVAMYIGSPAPLKQGYIDDRFQLSCPVPIASGPGKVVLHQ